MAQGWWCRECWAAWRSLEAERRREERRTADIDRLRRQTIGAWGLQPGRAGGAGGDYQGSYCPGITFPKKKETSFSASVGGTDRTVLDKRGG